MQLIIIRNCGSIVTMLAGFMQSELGKKNPAYMRCKLEAGLTLTDSHNIRLFSEKVKESIS